MSGAVAAVVVAIRGGQSLRAAVEAVSWADQRVVFDPGRRVDCTAAGEPVVSTPTLDGAARLSWILLLAENERVPPGTVAAVRSAVGGPEAVWRIGREIRTLGVRFRPRSAAVRLAPAGSRVTLTPGLGLALEPPPASGLERPRRLRARLRVHGPASLAEAVDELTAEARMLAALLAQGGASPDVSRIAGTSVAASIGILTARADRPAGMGRWITGVLHGYRNVLAWTTLWEQRRGGVEVR